MTAIVIGPPAGKLFVRHQLVGVIDGSNDVFTTPSNFASGSTVMYLNGLAQSIPEDYVEVPPNQVQMAEPALIGDALLIVYRET